MTEKTNSKVTHILKYEGMDEMYAIYGSREHELQDRYRELSRRLSDRAKDISESVGERKLLQERREDFMSALLAYYEKSKSHIFTIAADGEDHSTQLAVELNYLWGWLTSTYLEQFGLIKIINHEMTLKGLYLKGMNLPAGDFIACA